MNRVHRCREGGPGRTGLRQAFEERYAPWASPRPSARRAPHCPARRTERPDQPLGRPPDQPRPGRCRPRPAMTRAVPTRPAATRAVPTPTSHNPGGADPTSRNPGGTDPRRSGSPLTRSLPPLRCSCESCAEAWGTRRHVRPRSAARRRCDQPLADQRDRHQWHQ
ncbi:hypothetical protein SSTG_05089 [Streptomyces sp. e14]|nr:hypothetical protein SSTG_05089 [Streptomyces sp. e14]